MFDDDIKAIAKQLDAALVIIGDIQEKSGCTATSEKMVRGKPRHHSAKKVAQTLYKNRRARDEFFDSEKIFGEPAWDILLDLYANQASIEGVATKSVVVGSASPPTTALRWLNVLATEGIITSKHNSHDNRVRLISFTPKGFEAMTSYLNLIELRA